MTMDDILNINTVYFSDLIENIKLFSKGERYAIYVVSMLQFKRN